MKGVALLLTCALALVPKTLDVRVPRQSDAKIVMKTGSQVPYRIRRKRLMNQNKGRVRLNIFRSNKHIYAQVIDDYAGHTVASCSTLDPEVAPILEQDFEGKGGNKPASTLVGSKLAERLKAKGIESVYYDRFSGSHKYLYHGRIAALVDGVRDGGITI